MRAAGGKGRIAIKGELELEAELAVCLCGSVACDTLNRLAVV